MCGIKDWCEDQCRFVVLLYKTTCFDGELHSSSEGRCWWEDIANLPNLKLSLDMRDMLRVFIGSRNLYLLGKYNHFSIFPVKAVIPK